MLNNKVSKAVRLALLFGAASSSVISASAFAAEKDEDLLEEKTERISVTGSRIRKAEFSSASPIQVIDVDIEREFGTFDTSKMLTSSTQASGTQVDSTFGGFVTDNGPGAATIGFRGLGPGRTLVLVNGRRVAPSGIGGAPVAADVSLIPSVMVQRIDNLFDGASTTYGSDAIAGVSNVILKKDVEGFEIIGGLNKTKGGGGENRNLGVLWGTTSDNGFITVGGSYEENTELTYGQAAFARSGCEAVLHETMDGRIIEGVRDIGPSKLQSQAPDCGIFPLHNRIINDTWSGMGSIYHTPGFTNIGIPNFSESTTSAGLAGFYGDRVVGADLNLDGENDTFYFDADGDGYQDVDFFDPYYSFGKAPLGKNRQIMPRQRVFGLMVNGEYTFDNTNTTMFYELLHSKRITESSSRRQLYAVAPASNPFNPLGKMDAYGPLINEHGYYYGSGADTSFTHYIKGHNEHSKPTVTNSRAVIGLTGDAGFVESLGFENGYYELSFTHSIADGHQKQVGIGGEQLEKTLNAVQLEDGTITCGEGCVPVNFFADNMFGIDGATLQPHEQEYLFVTREMNTEVKQSLLSGLVGADLFELPWNNETVAGVVGFEYRKDKISTDANKVAAEGLFYNYFSDKGANGSRTVKEAYAEVDFPLLSGVEYAEELSVTLAGRLTKEDSYDTASIHSVKAIYRPTEWLTLRGTRGTSYRTPDLGQRFKSGTSGFRNGFVDPCVVPTAARDTDNLADPNAAPVYLPDEDTRDADLLAACRGTGVDPTSLGLLPNGESYSASGSVEIEVVGAQHLKEEKSTSRTFGFVYEQPFTDAFDLTLSVTRFDIEVEDAIDIATLYDYRDRCYYNEEFPNGDSPFCQYITRNAKGQIEGVKELPFNMNEEIASGVDYNLDIGTDFLIGSETLELSLDVRATRMREQGVKFDGTYDNNIGEPFYAKKRVTTTLTGRYSDFTFGWRVFYIGKGKRDNQLDFEADTDGCYGLKNDDGSPLLCRRLDNVDQYTRHNLFAKYSFSDDLAVSFGIDNVFNDEPPRVDEGSSTRNIMNTATGGGYDFGGRTAYLQFKLTM